MLCVPSSVPVQFAMDDPANEDLFATPTPAASMYYPDWMHCVRGRVGALGGGPAYVVVTPMALPHFPPLSFCHVDHGWHHHAAV